MIHEKHGSPQGPAVTVEHTLRRIFVCDREGVGGIANSDNIRIAPICHMMYGLMSVYSQSKDENICKKIEEIYSHTNRLTKYSIDDFFEENEDICEYMECLSSADLIMQIIDDFDSIVNKAME